MFDEDKVLNEQPKISVVFTFGDEAAIGAPGLEILEKQLLKSYSCSNLFETSTVW